MFYDLEDPHTFVQDVYDVLDDDGLWVIQMSYLPLMLQQLAFDNICHEHLEYYSLTSLKYLLDAHKFDIVDCQVNEVYGGSFRVFLRKASAKPSAFANAPYRDVARYRVNSILEYEKTLGLTDPEDIRGFLQKSCDLRDETLAFMRAEKAKGKRYGHMALPPKAIRSSSGGVSTIRSWTASPSVPSRNSVSKTVGTNIPIRSEEEMRKAKPDYLLVLPWHFIDSFVAREQAFLKGGGAFIVPCPRFEVIRG